MQTSRVFQVNWLLPLVVLTATTALAGDCDDDLNECKEDCLIQYGGSIRLEVKKAYERCMKKCLKTSTRCTEAAIEARNVGLDDSPAPKPAPRDDDEPVTAKKPKKKLTEPRTTEEPSAAPKEALREGEVPKSTRSAVISDEKPSPVEPPPKKVEKVEPPPATKPKAEDEHPAALAAPPPPPPKKEEKPKPAAKKEDDDDLRNY
jgi:hypothetical protein